jgi:hypothetical protein
MTDKKISQLTGATSPLAGTEELPIVQSGSTKKVTVANLTAGRSVSASELVVDNITVDGNTISSTNTNGNIIFEPNGSGVAVVQGDSGASTGTVTAPVTYLIKDTAQVSTGGDTTNAWGKLKWETVDSSSGGPGGGAEIGLVYNNAFGVGYKMYIATSENNAAPKKRIEIQPFGNIEFYQNDGITKHSEFVAATGNLNLLLGNLVIGTAAKGIDFSANTGAAGMTSELLNWYEEGTWTPTLQFGGASTGITYTTQRGYYTRIGRQVTVSGRIEISSKGLSTGTATINGLPFTINTNSDTVQVLDAGSGFQNLIAGGCLFVGGQTANTFMYIFISITTGRSLVDDTYFGASASFSFQLSYFV